jgi:bifunctional DNA primase/polymerase-like protein
MQGNAAAVALAYCRRCWPVFPCRRDNKQPLVRGGFHAATTDEPQIRWWLRSWPLALIGVPTGKTSGFVVLDVDVKRLDAKGFDTLAELGHAVLRNTPMVHTASGGLHLYFDPAGRKICNTQRDRGSGIGRGLDVRGYGGYVIVPSPGSGYDSDPFANLDILPLAPAPDWLVARRRSSMRLLVARFVRHLGSRPMPTRRWIVPAGGSSPHRPLSRKPPSTVKRTRSAALPAPEEYQSISPVARRCGRRARCDRTTRAAMAARRGRAQGQPRL